MTTIMNLVKSHSFDSINDTLLQTVPPLNSFHIAGLTAPEMELVKNTILDMWRQAGTVLEIFCNEDALNEGYRLKVKNDLAVKLTIRQQDSLICGWVAQIPPDLSEAHAFKRSWVEPNGYLGGPISYMNWCNTSKQQVNVIPSINNKAFIKLHTKSSLPAGTELRWNYGRSSIPDWLDWFNKEVNFCSCVYSV